jgi:hypothetical protein
MRGLVSFVVMMGVASEGRRASTEASEALSISASPTPSLSLSQLQASAIIFDVFGTVVDWRTSVTREVENLARKKGLGIDGAKFADAWRAGYGPSMNRVRIARLSNGNIALMTNLMVAAHLGDLRAARWR